MSKPDEPTNLDDSSMKEARFAPREVAFLGTDALADQVIRQLMVENRRFSEWLNQLRRNEKRANKSFTIMDPPHHFQLTIATYFLSRDVFTVKMEIEGSRESAQKWLDSEATRNPPKKYW